MLLAGNGSLVGCNLFPAGHRATARSGASANVCGPIHGGNFTGRMVVDNLRRSYLIHVPPHLPQDRRHPLVFVFHGPQSSGKEIARYSNMSALADQHHFVTVYPNAWRREASDFATWIAGSTVPVDLDFVSRLINGLSRRLCVDRDRIYAAGFSSGANMAFGLACQFGDRIAAVGAVAGFYALEDAKDCHPEHWTSVIAFHGTADPRIPYLGTVAVLSTAGWMRRWVRRARCKHDPTRVWGRKDVIVMDHSGCRGNSEVRMYTIWGGGHTWPGSPVHWPPDYGRVTHTVRASEAMWIFFEAHPLRLHR